MDTVLVISDEAALAETLSSELPGITVEAARFAEAAAKLRLEKHHLVVIDEGGQADIPSTGKPPVIRLTRPVALSALLYTIRERLQGKSAGARAEIALPDGLRLSPPERLLRAADGTAAALTEKEMELLLALAEAEAPVARDAMLKRIWGYSDEIATHTLETHLYRLRGKLKRLGARLDIVFLEEGGGYSLQS